MSGVCIYFQVHQPRRVRRYGFFDVGEEVPYFDEAGAHDTNNRAVLEKVARKCYLPANALMLELLQAHPEFRVAYSLSGIFIEQCREYAPEVLASFRTLARTGRVEFLGETYYHSLAFLRSPDEFSEQIKLHGKLIEEEFGLQPRVFRNTELIYRNDLAPLVEALGFSGMLVEGADHVLDWRSPAFLYHAVHSPRFPLLLKHYRLSDDIAFRFSERSWQGWPMTAEKFAHWLHAYHGSGELINLFMDYETIGEHQWEDTGIFSFWRALPEALLRHPDTHFFTPSEAIAAYRPVGVYDAPQYVSWADVERDLSAWASNDLQHDALEALFALERRVKQSNDASLLSDWRRLSTSDHFYYMCTKWFQDGDVHAYFNPYASPYDAYIAYMHVLVDLELRIAQASRPALRTSVLHLLQTLSTHLYTSLCDLLPKRKPLVRR